MAIKICSLKIIAMLYCLLKRLTTKKGNPLAYDEILLHDKILIKVVAIQNPIMKQK